MHQLTLGMARSINRIDQKEAAKKAGISYEELVAAEKDSRSLSFDSAIKLQKLYKLPDLSMIFLGEEDEFRITNDRSGLDLLELYIDFLRLNRKQASYIMVWFEAVTEGLEMSEKILVQRTIEELSKFEGTKIKELKKTVDYMMYIG